MCECVRVRLCVKERLKTCKWEKWCKPLGKNPANFLSNQYVWVCTSDCVGLCLSTVFQTENSFTSSCMSGFHDSVMMLFICHCRTTSMFRNTHTHTVLSLFSFISHHFLNVLPSPGSLSVHVILSLPPLHHLPDIVPSSLAKQVSRSLPVRFPSLWGYVPNSSANHKAVCHFYPHTHHTEDTLVIVCFLFI